MGFRINLVLAKLRLKATTSDFEWTQTDERVPRDGGGHGRISFQSYPHREDSQLTPPRKPSVLKGGYLLVVSHNHLQESKKKKKAIYCTQQKRAEL